MRLGPLEANLICLGLVTADFTARAVRLSWLVRGTGHHLSVRDSLVTSLYTEAGATLTPLRLGGEPARVAGMLSSGVPAAASFVAIAYEVITAWPVLIAVAAAIFGWWAPQWWREVGVQLGGNLRAGWPWVALVALLTLAAWWLGRRLARLGSHRVRRPLRRIAVYWRRMPWWPVAASAACSLVNVLSRIAILPVLALALPDPPALPTLVVGSFGLVYSQMVLPTPAGAGAVELGLLAGAAGNLGDERHWVLLAWRFYLNGLGSLLGVVLAAHAFGWPALRHAVRRLLGPSAPA
ncbi:MAG: YbhN family protein [Gemmatimonadales bacterium]|nr:YbhN family protein [Gemmatimonadales bacterium]